MNDSFRVTHRRWPVWRWPVRTAVTIAVTAVLALSVAACSGSGHTPSAGSATTPAAGGSAGASGSTGSTTTPSAVAYSACMRTHGVPAFPDPDPANGQVPKSRSDSLGVSAAQFQAAQSACQHLYPDNGSLDQRTRDCMLTDNCPQALVQQLLAVERQLARCLRAHGVPDWPDPIVDAQGRPLFPLSSIPGRNRSYWRSPQVDAKVELCQQQIPGGSPIPTA